MNRIMNRIMNYCSKIWHVESCLRPNYYKKTTSRTRSRSYPHFSFRSHSDESIGLGIYSCFIQTI